MKKKFNFLTSFIWLAIIIFVVDIVTKWCVHNYFLERFPNTIYSTSGIRDISEMICIIPNFLYIGFALNKGAAWSLGTTEKFDGVNPILIVISVLMSAVLIFYYVKNYKKLKGIIKACLMLMIAGALGNMVDRIFYRTSITGFKGVIDWIQAYPFGKPFPTFNIADSSLVVGVAILLVYFIVIEIKEAINKGKKGEYKYSPNEIKEQKENEKNNSK